MTALPAAPAALPGLIRAEQWWAYKGPPVLLAVYAVALRADLPPSAVWRVAGWLVLSLAPAAAYANLLNDWTDIAQDARAGKTNRMAGKPLWFCAAALAVPLALGSACAWAMRDASLSLALYASVWLVFTLYSVRPFRLKCRRLAGVAADALGAHLLLTLYALAYVAYATGVAAARTPLGISLCALSLISGLRGILAHQILDRDADRRGAVATFVAGQDPWVVRRAIERRLWPAELAAGLALLLVLADAMVAAFVAAGLMLDHIRARQLNLRVGIVPRTGTDMQALLDIYDLWLPVGVLCAFAVRQPLGWWLPVAHLGLFPGHAVRAGGHVWHFARWRLYPLLMGAPFASRHAVASRDVPTTTDAATRLSRDANVLRDGLHVVLAPPKTGSSTVAATLAALPIPGAVHRVHTLSPELATDRRVWEQAETFAHTRDILPYAVEEVWRTSALVRMMLTVANTLPEASSSEAARINVIVPLREPVARCFSSMFYFCWYLHGDGAARLLTPEFVTARLMADQESTAWAGTPNWWSYDIWLDRELRDGLGIDVMAEPFDTDRGWQVYDGRIARALVIRQESFGTLGEALETFYSLPVGSVAVIRANEAADHAYAEAYGASAAAVRIAAARLDQVYGARFARHFYSPSERVAFARRWSGGAAPPRPPSAQIGVAG